MQPRIIVPTHRPRPTYIYLIQEHFGLYKIGVAYDVKARLDTLQISTPYPLRLCTSTAVENALRVESFVHSLLEQYHVKGEWFKLPHTRVFHNAIKAYRAALSKPHIIVTPEPKLWTNYNNEIRGELLKR